MSVTAAQIPRARRGVPLDVRVQLERVRAENARLRQENRRLRASLDGYLARAQATQLFGPMEMTAGTCVGPRHVRSMR